MLFRLLLIFDQILTTAVINTRYIKVYLSYRVGTIAAILLKNTQGIIWKLAKLYGLVSIEKDVLESGLSNTPIKVPEYPAFFLNNGDDILAKELLNGNLKLQCGKALPIKNISWINDPFHGRSSLERLLFHSLDSVNILIDLYKKTKNNKCLFVAENITEKWIDECLIFYNNDNLWSDHATALRSIILCRLWCFCIKSHKDKLFLNILLSTIFIHGGKLENDHFYRKNHNHGVTQAYALFIIGLMFPTYYKSQNWIELGKSRIQKQMYENVSSEGIHNEHSPYYNYYVLQHFCFAHELSKAFQIRFDEKFYKKLLEMLLKCELFVKPNGKLLGFGDTSDSSEIVVGKTTIKKVETDVIKLLNLNENQYKERKRVLSKSSIFPNAGYVIFRGNEFNGEKNKIYMVMRLSTFNSSHIHIDIFSFELYYNSKDLIVDSGGPYNYLSKKRDYFISTLAHNTVVVNNNNQNIGGSKIIHWKTSKKYDLLVAEHYNYPGVVHKRIVLFIKNKYIIIFDIINGKKICDYSLLYHLNQKFEYFQEGLDILAKGSDNKEKFLIKQLLDNNIDSIIYKGSVSPLQGWLCTGENKMIPNTVIEYRKKGKNAVFGTIISFEYNMGRKISLNKSNEREVLKNGVIKFDINGFKKEIIEYPTGKITING